MMAELAVRRALPLASVMVWGDTYPGPPSPRLPGWLHCPVSTAFTWSRGPPFWIWVVRCLRKGMSQTFLQAAQQPLAHRPAHRRWRLDESLLRCSARAGNSLAAFPQ